MERSLRFSHGTFPCAHMSPGGRVERILFPIQGVLSVARRIILPPLGSGLPWGVFRGDTGVPEVRPILQSCQEYRAFIQRQVQHKTRALTPFYERWKRLRGVPPWVLRTIEHGHEIRFSGIPPPPTGVIATEILAEDKAQVLLTEISEMLSKNAIRVVERGAEGMGYYSPYFVIPKKTGGMRPILNLKQFNKWVRREEFHMLKVPQLLSMVRKNDHFTSVDLKDAYFHIPIAERHRKYLRFSFQGVNYEYTVLPFGYSLAPRTFSACVKAALSPLQARGHRIAYYLDDLLVFASSPRLAMTRTVQLIEHLAYLGLSVNWKKSALWPTCQVTYLGLAINSVAMRATISAERWQAMQVELAGFEPGRRVTVGQLRRLLGRMSSAHQVVPLGLLFMRRLQGWFIREARSRPLRDRHVLVVPEGVQPDLDHWTRACESSVGVPLGLRSEEVVLFTDSSLEGWGAICGYSTVRDVWAQDHGTHINALELKAILLAVRHFAPLLRGRHILVRTDSTTAVAYVNRQGGTKSQACLSIAYDLWGWVHQNALSIRAVHVPGKQNEAADVLSRGGPSMANWSLNPIIVEMIWRVFGEARVDLFASRTNAKCDLWFSLNPSDNPPLGVNALGTEPWPQGLLYAFPPVDLLPEVVGRVNRTGASVILVAPCNPGSSWYPNMVAMAKREPFQLPMWVDAMTQAGGILRDYPALGGFRLAAWLLNGPGC